MHSMLFLITGIFAMDVGAQWTFTGNSSASWEEAIARYRELDQRHTRAKLLEIGHDDDGSTIHLFVIASNGVFDPDAVERNTLWITNGIHPGEPDGIDASLIFAKALLEDDHLAQFTRHTTVCIVPVYNVWGAKQRQRPSRPDQNGPEEHGIRANAKNLDLNRDFVKLDASNSRALIAALQQWDPDVYFETHVSDGADHQYVMELLPTQKDKLDGSLGSFMAGTLIPDLHAWMDSMSILMCPYFETLREVPDSGLVEFLDSPRYSTGYNALFDRIGILAESHMLKPFADRVNATLQLMLATVSAMDRHHEELQQARAQAIQNTVAAGSIGSNWELDTTHVEMLPFMGYAFTQTPSPVSGLPRLAYDRSRPVDLLVPWYGRYKPALEIRKPRAYLVPQAWKEVIDRLLNNGVKVITLDHDSLLDVEVYRIEEYATTRYPFEGHYLHHAIQCSLTLENAIARKGDVLIQMGRSSDRFVMAVLEPACSDSYFAWGFFDPILQQKEWFSPYAFEEKAAELLEKDPTLREAFDARRANDPAFAADGTAQLVFILTRSAYGELAFKRYPVLRVIDP